MALKPTVPASTYSITLGETQENLLAPLILPQPTISPADSDVWSPVLTGTSGNDIFNPGTNDGGTAYMYGGTGNEVFYVYGFNDVVVAKPGGIDTIITEYGWGIYTLPANVQNLIYNGNASYSNGWITLQGNALNDTLVANNNGIKLEAGTGMDTLVGGTGNDIFVIAAGDAGDTIIGLHTGDTVQMNGFAFSGYAALQAAMTQSGNNVVVTLGGSQTLTLVNQTRAQLQAAEFNLPPPPPPVAQTPNLLVSSAAGTDGTAVPLSISAALVDADSGETLAVLISGLPQGATLSAGTADGNGTWTLTASELSGLALTVPGSAAAADSLTVTAVATETDGSTAATSATLALTLAAPPLVAQMPTLLVSPATGTYGTAVPLAISASLAKLDPGEALSVRISGLPQGATLSAGTADATGTWTLAAGELSGLTLTVPGTEVAADSLTISAIATELDGSTATATATLALTLAAPSPVAQAPTLQVTAANGTAGMPVPLAISAALTQSDPGEALSVLISGLPQDAILSAGTADATGTWTLTAAELSGLALTASGSAAAVDSLTVSAVATEIDGSTATTTASLALTLASPVLTYSITLGGTQQNLLAPLMLPQPTISPADNDAWSPVLTGTNGNDIFNPGTNAGGTAHMYGGTGNEVFYVYGGNDVVVAEAGGTDTIITEYGWGVYTLPANVQNLIYDGSESYSNGWITLQGNTLNDTLVANNNGVELDAGSGNDTLVGGTGNDIFVIAAGDAGDTIIGLHAGDTVQLNGFAFSEFSALQMAMTQSGSNVVVALGGGQTLTLVDQTVAGLDATEFGLPAPAGATTSGSSSTGSTSTGSTSTGSTSTGSTGGTTSAQSVTDPAVPQATEPGQVVGFVLRNNETAPLLAQDVSFTEVFSAGAVPEGSGLVATVNGQVIPVQMDVLTTNPDGSAAMATLTLLQPALAAGQSENGMLSLASATAAAPISIGALATDGYQLGVALTMHNTDGSTTPYMLNAVSLMQQAIVAGTARTILQGPQVTKVEFTTPIASSMYLTFDLSLYADGSVSANVQFDNDIAMSASGGTADYDVTITQNGTIALQQDGISQAQYTSWNQPLSTQTSPQAQVVLDINALEDTGAIPNYDPSEGVSEATIAGETAQLGGPTYAILGSASVSTYMPTTGGRGDIGPQPQWDAIWLMTQDPGAIEFALAQANAAGSVPWNFINPTTGANVTLTDYPDLWVDGRGGSSSYTTGLTQAVPTDTVWTADTAHQPDLSYLAYLLTGNVVYLDELNSQASWAELDDWPTPRQEGLGLVANGYDQVRAQAWSLREIDEAAYANPDGSAMKLYFTQLEDNNWSWLVSQIPTWTQQEGTAYGYVPSPFIANGVPEMRPWQQDYFISTAVQAAEMGNQDAVTFLNWEANFIVGRFLNEANGFDPNDGIAYTLVIGTAAGTPLQTWAQIEQATQVTEGSNGTGWSESAGDYGELALQSLAGIITVTQSVSAIQAYGWLLASGAPFTDPSPDAQFDIVPRLSDGNLLTSANLIISHDVVATAIIGSKVDDQLIYAGSGDDTLTGGNGINILFAGSGNDSLIGGSGNDYLYAGTGDDTLYAGAGANYLQADSGGDIFQLNLQDVAKDVIAKYKIGIDHLQLLGDAASPIFEAQLIDGATADAGGNVVLHLSATHSVTLQGINVSQLSQSVFS